ncbi:hypothetical protein D3C85_1430760 [compost metagenome]
MKFAAVIPDRGCSRAVNNGAFFRDVVLLYRNGLGWLLLPFGCNCIPLQPFHSLTRAKGFQGVLVATQGLGLKPVSPLPRLMQSVDIFNGLYVFGAQARYLFLERFVCAGIKQLLCQARGRHQLDGRAL